MANYCLPSALVKTLRKAIQDKQIDPFALRDVTSEQRRSILAGYVGDDHAKELNARFEEALLPKYKEGILDWVRNTLNPKDPAYKNILDKVEGMDSRILGGSGQFSALSDLASERLKTGVTTEEAQVILDLSKKARDAKDEWVKGLDTDVSRQEHTAVMAGKTTGDLDKDAVIRARNDYGDALQTLKDKVEELKPDGQTYDQKLLNLLTFPKTIATGILHLSAIGVQGWGMISKKVAYEGFAQQLRYFGSESRYRELQNYIVSHPDYKFAVDGKLGLTDVSDRLSAREEAIQSSLAQDFSTYLADKTGGPDVIRASGRAFTGYLNYVRFNRYVDLLNAARNVGEDVSMGSTVVRDLAAVVNNFTGRASLDFGQFFGKAPTDVYAQHQAALNTVFFAPRKIAATVQMFNPVEYVRLAREHGVNSTAFKAAVGQITGSVMATMAVLQLAKAVGYQVDFNPTSSDFLKIQLGNDQKMDITGGNAIWIRLLARMMTGEMTTGSGVTKTVGQGYNPLTRASMAADFVRGKLSPVAGALTDMMEGKTQVGGDVTFSTEARSRLLPIVFDNFISYFEQNPNKSLSDLPILAGAFGYNTESPIPPAARNGYTVWGEPTDKVPGVGYEWHDPVPTELDDQLRDIGYTGAFPPKTINGINLTKQQYMEYQVKSGQLAKTRLQQYVSSPSFQGMNKVQQLKVVNGVVNSSRKLVQGQIMAENYGGENDIMRQSMENKLKKQGITN